VGSFAKAEETAMTAFTYLARRSLIARVAVFGLGVGLTVTAPAPAHASAAAASCAGQPATITGTSGDDVLAGTPGPDVISGLAGDDILRGLGGDDVLCGGDGGDQLVGGDGADALHGGRSGLECYRDSCYYYGDTLRPGPGDDLVDGGVDPRTTDDDQPDALDYSRVAQAVTVDLPAGTADGDGHDQIVAGERWEVIGSAFDDVITGTDLADWLDGAGGADTIAGGAGNDQLGGLVSEPDHAADTLSGGEGNDFLYTREGPDTLTGGPGDDQLFDRDRDADVLHGGDGNDSLYADLGGRDQLYGDAGDDELNDYLVAGTGQVDDGGAGTNTISLRTRLVQDQTIQRVTGTTDLRDGNTTVDWPVTTTATVQNAATLIVPGHWTVWGTDAAETVRGGYDGPIAVHAGGGDDQLFGTAYADFLGGGDGTDYARPGKGDDSCDSIEHTDLPGNACDQNGVVGPTDLASVSSAGVQTDAGSRVGYRPAISAGGRYVVFTTPAALVPEDTNGVSDVYLRDRSTDLTTRISETARGGQLSRASEHGDISANGRFVAFESRGAAVPRSSPGPARIYVRDRSTGKTTLVSVNNHGRPASSQAFSPTISADGNRVAFVSYADNMGVGGPGVYVRDRERHRTILANVRPDGKPSTQEVYSPTISRDGRFVTFLSYDNQLTPSGRNGLFVRDLQARHTDWVGSPPAYYESSSISADGRIVAFTERDPQCAGQIFDCTVVVVENRDTGATQIASVTPDGQRPDGGSAFPVLSGDGRFVLFTSWAGNIVEDDANRTADVFVRDLRTGITTLVSTDVASGPAGGPSGSPQESSPGAAFSDAGGWIAFESDATDLVEGDANGMADLFVRSWQVPQ
jgi:Ca2+-binding RTX toxin-like protein